EVDLDGTLIREAEVNRAAKGNLHFAAGYLPVILPAQSGVKGAVELGTHRPAAGLRRLTRIGGANELDVVADVASWSPHQLREGEADQSKDWHEAPHKQALQTSASLDEGSARVI